MESAMSSQAVADFIDRNHDRINLVVLSRPWFHHTRQKFSTSLEFALFLAWCFLWQPVSARVTGKHASIHAVCARYGIPYMWTGDVNTQRIHALLQEKQVDLVLTCLFDQILQEALIRIPPGGCINIHPGLLPQCRGVFPEIHTAAGKCPDFGFTVHTIENTQIDQGRVLLKEQVVTEHRDILSISQELLGKGLQAFEGLLEDYNTALQNARPQAGGDYYSYPARSDLRRLKQAGYSLI